MEEERAVEEKKKKGTGKNIIIVVLTIIIIGLLGFITYDKNILGIKDKLSPKHTIEQETRKEKEEKEEELSLTDESFLGLYKYTEDRSNGYKSFSAKELGQAVIHEVKVEDITMLEEKSNIGYPYCTFKASIIENKLKEVFGPKVGIDKNGMIGISGENINGGFQVESYDKETDTFRCRTYPTGHVSGPSPKTTERALTKAVKKGDTITVTERVIYLKSESTKEVATYHIYSDKSYSNEIDTKTIDNTDWKNIENLVITVEDYLEKAGTIIYTYQLNKDTGNYYFVSSSIQ